MEIAGDGWNKPASEQWLKREFTCRVGHRVDVQNLKMKGQNYEQGSLKEIKIPFDIFLCITKKSSTDALNWWIIFCAYLRNVLALNANSYDLIL